ncbi:MFS transporter [Actinosynnema pretiosum subsp. pretiosum]|uniref:MFS transporter n=1 Tax=Actinosynnema pretiosum subsp. pretiosum TaxID=103721 RepID=A0AA45L601_9PSEU|nr:putative multidrug efflux transport protein [Actinosynnema pretiosum subsp. pretiosum]QUF03698.1 MFS transporter [Actinosynnema pretiosum subsp. pretiosum]
MNPERRRRALLPVVLSATFAQLLNVTLVQVAAPVLRADLGAGPGAAHLVLAAFTLGHACPLIASARLGDRFGHRALFALGAALFALATAACAVAPSTGALVAARLLQGAGSGIAAPQVFSLIRTALPAHRHGRALAAFGAVIGTASAIGPVLGGALLAADPLGLGWRALFLAQLPVALAALAGSALLPAAEKARDGKNQDGKAQTGKARTGKAQNGKAQNGKARTGKTQNGKAQTGRPQAPQRVDALGAALVAACCAALVLPLAVGPDAGWPPWAFASLGAAVVLGAAFLLSQRLRADPLVHPEALRHRATRTGVLVVLVFNAGVPSLTYLVLLHLQEQGRTPLQAALVNTPYALAAVLGSALAPALAEHRRTTPAAAAALALVTAALTALPLGPVPLALGGAAFGLFTSTVFALVLSRAPEPAAASVAGLLPTAQQLGGTVGVALAGTAHAAGGFPAAMAYESLVFALAAAGASRLVTGGPATTKPSTADSS